MENNSNWKSSYYLAVWPIKRLIPCLTMDPPEGTLSRPEASTVLIDKQCIYKQRK